MLWNESEKWVPFGGEYFVDAYEPLKSREGWLLQNVSEAQHPCKSTIICGERETFE